MLDREWLALRTDSAFLNRLAVRFFELRIRRYPTQEEAASRLGVTTKDIQRIEQGLAHLLSFHKIERLAKLAGTTASELIALARSASPAPSIAVLPFSNLSRTLEEEYFAEGIVIEVIAALSRIRSIMVRDRSSTLGYKGQQVDAKRIGLELGVRYLVEGSVQRDGERVRISAALIDATAGICLWGDRFDGSLLEVFDLQAKVALGVAGVIEPTLQAIQLQRMAGRPVSDLAAYDLYLRGYAMMVSSAKLIPEALTLLEEAIKRDPSYGPALACAALCYFRLTYDGRSQDHEADRTKSTDLARRALEVAAADPDALVNAALALAGFGENLAEMTGLVEHALDLNPAFARGWYVSSNMKNWSGELETAIEHAESSLHLSPRARVGGCQCVIGAAHFYSRRFNEALPKLRIAIAEDPSHPQAYRFLAACYAHLGRIEEARAVMARLRTVTADPLSVGFTLRNERHRQLLLAGMRLASGDQR